MFIKSPIEWGRKDESREQTHLRTLADLAQRVRQSQEGSAQDKLPESFSVAANEKADLRDSTLLTIYLWPGENFKWWKKRVCMGGGLRSFRNVIIWSKSLLPEVGGVAAGPVMLQTKDGTILLEHCTWVP